MALYLNRRVVFIGGGPASMQAAIYLASEGVQSVVIERNKIGGQIQQTPRVDNIFGLPGISGPELSQRLERQYMSFNPLNSSSSDQLADIYYNDVERVIVHEHGSYKFEVQTYNYKSGVMVTFYSDAVVVGSGLSWDVTSVERLVKRIKDEGRLLVGPYASMHPEFRTGRHKIVVIGGGNSAGQGILELVQRNPYVEVHVVCRSGIRMSEYLGRQVVNHPSVTVHHGQLDASYPAINAPGYSVHVNLGYKNHSINEVTHCMYAGSSRPNTGFLRSDLSDVIDEDGFVIRPDYIVGTYTAINGLFAIGDVVAGNPKRCMRAVGDGSQAATDIHNYLITNTHPQSTTS